MRSLLLAFCLVLALGGARAQQPAPAAAGLACHNCAFSDDIDKQIALSEELVANGDSCEPQHLLELVPAQPGTPELPDESADSFTTSKAVRWSAWSGRLYLLSWYLPDKPRAGGPYTRLPDAAGRQLFLAGGGAVLPGLLLEFQGPRFRFIMLNYESSGKTTHWLYHHPDSDLLVLAITDGVISKIFSAYTTWLSVFDLRRNTWLLDTVVEADHEGDDYWYTQRRYQVQDAGRTVVLGPYRDRKGKYQSATLKPGQDLPRSNHDLPPGTYHFAEGRYQRAPAGPPPAPRPGLAPAPRRPAISAAEVNGTFRDAQGREFALLALGGGKLRVGFRDAFTQTAGVYHRHTFVYDARIAADSAVLTVPAGAPSPETCSLRLRFERPGTLQVRENGRGCRAEAVGTYTKISEAKPTFQ